MAGQADFFIQCRVAEVLTIQERVRKIVWFSNCGKTVLIDEWRSVVRPAGKQT